MASLAAIQGGVAHIHMHNTRTFTGTRTRIHSHTTHKDTQHTYKRAQTHAHAKHTV